MNLENKCVMCVFIALPCTFLLPSKDFLSSAELLQELLGLLFLLFLIPHTLTEATPPAPPFLSFLKSLPYHYVPTSHSVVNFTPFWRCNRQICPCMTPCMPKLVWPSSSFKHNMGKGGGGGCGRSVHLPTPTPPVRILSRCKET